MCSEILGITRHGVAKMKESVLMLASFEKTGMYVCMQMHGWNKRICVNILKLICVVSCSCLYSGSSI